MEKITEEKAKQVFDNKSDCYADTWSWTGQEMKEGDVVQAMTKARFLEVLKELNLIE